jgi:hypothetical protein
VKGVGGELGHVGSSVARYRGADLEESRVRTPRQGGGRRPGCGGHGLWLGQMGLTRAGGWAVRRWVGAGQAYRLGPKG